MGLVFKAGQTQLGIEVLLMFKYREARSGPLGWRCFQVACKLFVRQDVEAWP
jgi:hypothetical protein